MHLFSTPRTPIRLEPMHQADLDRVLEIEAHSFSEPWERSFFLYELGEPNSRLYTARPAAEPERVVGFVCHRLIVDEVHVFNIAVDPEWRGRKIGSALLDRCIADARRSQAVCVTLEVRKSNVPALRMYRRAGFVLWGVRRGYYANREDAWIMWLDLTGSGAGSPGKDG